MKEENKVIIAIVGIVVCSFALGWLFCYEYHTNVRNAPVIELVR
jgi:hypothetical protein